MFLISSSSLFNHLVNLDTFKAELDGMMQTVVYEVTDEYILHISIVFDRFVLI